MPNCGEHSAAELQPKEVPRVPKVPKVYKKSLGNLKILNVDDLIKSRHSGGNRSPEDF